MSRPRTTVRRSSAFVAALAVLGLLGACAQGDAGRANAGTSGDSADGIAQAREAVAGWSEPLTEYPEEPALSQAPDMEGKKVTIIPLGDNIPVIHGVAVGLQDALESVGATGTICDGRFNPTSVADCLKQAGDQGADAVVTLFIDYAMAGTAFDALAAEGVPVLVGAVAPDPARPADGTLAYFDNTGRVGELYDAMSMAALAEGGEETNALWLRLMDSTTTRGASERGVATFEELCPTCGLATADFTTANLDKLPSAVSAALVANPETNVLIVPVDSFVGPALQGLQSAGMADQVTIVSSSSDVAGLQRVKDGQQVADLGTPVVYEGWKVANGLMQLLAGDEVQPADVLVTRNFNADNIDELELTDEAYFTTDWFGDDSFKAAFLEAWGVSRP
jgi:ribose transport system substrate-binding protein